MCSVGSVMSNSLRPRGRKSTWLLRPWDFPGKNTGVGCHAFFQCGYHNNIQLYSGFTEYIPEPGEMLSVLHVSALYDKFHFWGVV